MSDRWVTGSALSRALKCATSTVLERDGSFFSKNAERAAEFGTKAHSYIETREVLKGCEEWCSRIDRIGLDKLYPSKGGMNEVVAWYDPVSGKFELRTTPPGAERKHRDYSGIPESALCQTLDYINVEGYPYIIVDDLKTTSMDPPAPNCEQLLMAGMICHHIYRPTGPILLSITHVPRYPKLKPDMSNWDRCKPKRYKYWMPWEEAVKFRKKCDKLYQEHIREKVRVKLGLNQPRGGDHCKYCPCKKVCPLHKAENLDDN